MGPIFVPVLGAPVSLVVLSVWAPPVVRQARCRRTWLTLWVTRVGPKSLWHVANLVAPLGARVLDPRSWLNGAVRLLQMCPWWFPELAV